MKRISRYIIGDTGFFRLQGIVKSTVFGVFEDLKFKISEDYIQAKLKLSWLCPVGCLSLAETADRAETGQLQFWS